MDSHLPYDINSRYDKVDKIALLSQCPLFSGLSQWELKSISQLMRLVEYKKEEIIYREGEAGVSFYVVASGRFEAALVVQEKKKVLAYLRRGDYFGEMSLLTNQPHSATLKALSDSLVLELKKEDFKKTIESNASVSLELSRKLSSRIKGGDTRSRTLLKNDIISILSAQPRSMRTGFAINLAASLRQETSQKTVLLDLSQSGYQLTKKIPIEQFLNIDTNPLGSFSQFFTTHPSGFDILSLDYKGKNSTAENLITAILNHLAIDYRFILIDLPNAMDEVVFKTLTQSDTIYFVTDSSMTSITETKDIVTDIEKDISFPEEKISIVINEAFLGIRTTTIMRKELFGKKVCFSLPALPSTTEDQEARGIPFVVDEIESEYSRVIRHIARHVSNNLVGLVLGSGAALGLAHIGVLKVLEREKIPIDVIAGSSIGALIGSLYAVGKSADEIEKAAFETNNKAHLTKLFDLSIPPIRGLIKGKRIMKHFKTHLGDKTFDNCKIPLKITGANLSTRQTHIYESGYIWEAVRVSISIPAIFKPMFLNGDVMVDGGILSPLPIQALRQAGVNKIIAVNVFPSYQDTLERKIIIEEALEKEAMLVRQRNFLIQAGYKFKKMVARYFSHNIFDILMNTIQSMESEIADMEGQSADVLLRPVMPNANWVHFYKPQPFIKRGEEEAIKHLSKIKLLVSQQNV